MTRAVLGDWPRLSDELRRRRGLGGVTHHETAWVSST
jgi:hypothetical protein